MGPKRKSSLQTIATSSTKKHIMLHSVTIIMSACRVGWCVAVRTVKLPQLCSIQLMQCPEFTSCNIITQNLRVRELSVCASHHEMQSCGRHQAECRERWDDPTLILKYNCVLLLTACWCKWQWTVAIKQTHSCLTFKLFYENKDVFLTFSAVMPYLHRIYQCVMLHNRQMFLSCRMIYPYACTC